MPEGSPGGEPVRGSIGMTRSPSSPGPRTFCGLVFDATAAAEDATGAPGERELGRKAARRIITQASEKLPRPLQSQASTPTHLFDRREVEHEHSLRIRRPRRGRGVRLVEREHVRENGRFVVELSIEVQP